MTTPEDEKTTSGPENQADANAKEAANLKAEDVPKLSLEKAIKMRGVLAALLGASGGKDRNLNNLYRLVDAHVEKLEQAAEDEPIDVEAAKKKILERMTLDKDSPDWLSPEAGLKAMQEVMEQNAAREKKKAEKEKGPEAPLVVEGKVIGATASTTEIAKLTFEDREAILMELKNFFDTFDGKSVPKFGAEVLTPDKLQNFIDTVAKRADGRPSADLLAITQDITIAKTKPGVAEAWKKLGEDLASNKATLRAEAANTTTNTDKAKDKKNTPPNEPLEQIRYTQKAGGKEGILRLNYTRLDEQLDAALEHLANGDITWLNIEGLGSLPAADLQPGADGKAPRTTKEAMKAYVLKEQKKLFENNPKAEEETDKATRDRGAIERGRRFMGKIRQATKNAFFPENQFDYANIPKAANNPEQAEAVKGEVITLEPKSPDFEQTLLQRLTEIKAIIDENTRLSNQRTKYVDDDPTKDVIPVEFKPVPQLKVNGLGTYGTPGSVNLELLKTHRIIDVARIVIDDQSVQRRMRSR